jgi:alkanesulfonate monooxygenase SsuD/methylene tetrahydromethanopterin reductase-like flavin-dependent oxidoreductase (luciferase family)
MGGESEVVQKRTARIADGWMPHLTPGPKGQAAVDRMLTMVREAGRDPAQFGIEGRITLARVPRENWQKELEAWRAMRGITHLSIYTVGLGLEKPDQHVAQLEEMRQMVVAAGLAR